MFALINLLLLIICLAAEVVPVLADLAARREMELQAPVDDDRDGSGMEP